jgi:hypothetical protein
MPRRFVGVTGYDSIEIVQAFEDQPPMVNFCVPHYSVGQIDSCSPFGLVIGENDLAVHPALKGKSYGTLPSGTSEQIRKRYARDPMPSVDTALPSWITPPLKKEAHP